MNVGLYSFKTMKLIEAKLLGCNINRLFNVDDILLYSESTNRERMSERRALKKMLDDYDQNKIDLIVFKDMKALGSDAYMICKMLKQLLLNNYKFFCINERINSLDSRGIIHTKVIINSIEEEKKIADKRSRVGNEAKKYKIKKKIM